MPYLPIRPLHFTGGQKLAHTRVNLGPRHISETITGRKLKFYRHIDRSKYFFKAWKFSPLGGVRGAAPPSVNLGPPLISETIRARRLKFYIHLDRTKCSFRAGQFSARVRRGAGGRPGGLKLQCRAIATFSSFILFYCKWPNHFSAIL